MCSRRQHRSKGSKAARGGGPSQWSPSRTCLAAEVCLGFARLLLTHGPPSTAPPHRLAPRCPLVLPAGLLEALQSESPRSDGGSTPSPTAKAEDEYPAPHEAALLADGQSWAVHACPLAWLTGPAAWLALSVPSGFAAGPIYHTPQHHTPHPAAGLIEPLSLEMGEESEDELESLAAAAHENTEASPADSMVLAGAPPLTAGDELRASRFALLRDLWSIAG